MRDELKEFTTNMEFVLARNDDKEHWNNLTLDHIKALIYKINIKLSNAVGRNDLVLIQNTSLDLANYCMMMYDNASKLKQDR